MINCPEGADLMRVMNDEFKGLCYLPFCAGAIDGTFMKIEKHREWGDTYFCYKKLTVPLFCLHVLMHVESLHM